MSEPCNHSVGYAVNDTTTCAVCGLSWPAGFRPPSPAPETPPRGPAGVYVSGEADTPYGRLPILSFGPAPSPPQAAPAPVPPTPDLRDAVIAAARAVHEAMEGVRLPYKGDGWMRLIDLRNALAALDRAAPPASEPVPEVSTPTRERLNKIADDVVASIRCENGRGTVRAALVEAWLMGFQRAAEPEHGLGECHCGRFFLDIHGDPTFRDLAGILHAAAECAPPAPGDDPAKETR